MSRHSKVIVMFIWKLPSAVKKATENHMLCFCRNSRLSQPILFLSIGNMAIKSQFKMLAYSHLS